MKLLTKFGVMLIITLASYNAVAKQNAVNLQNVGWQLNSYASQLRNTAELMMEQAKTSIPIDLDQNQKKSFAAKQRDLKTTANSALNLAKQLDSLESRARKRTLMRIDMEGLGIVARPLSLKITMKKSHIPIRKIVIADRLNTTIKQVESIQEPVRNDRQESSTSFENFDQKANQLYNLLSSVMKSMEEMRMSTVRNMQ